jgi:hypothetical protein
MVRQLAALAALAFLLQPSAGAAQQRGGASGGASSARAGGAAPADSIPRAYMPPPGLCRVWVNGVPPRSQPAITDCASAVRNVPPNARVVYGDATASRGKLPPGVVNLTGTSKLAPPVKVTADTSARGKVVPPKVAPPRRDTIPEPHSAERR